MAIQTTDLTRLAQDFVNAFNHADWEQLASLVAPDFRYEETGTLRVVEGVDTYLTLCRQWKSAFPDAYGTIHIAIANDTFVGQEVTWEGTHSGPLAGPGGEIAPTNIRISIRGSLWYTVEDGRVRELHSHIDLMAMLQQLGVIPGPGTA
jgi:steroid delta-isomerase-like uncharacterized protein